MKVIVTDADDKKALAAVRFLGRKGAHVCAAGVKRRDQSLYSKYAAERLLYPNPVRDPDAFARFMLEFLERRHFDCVQPMSDYTTLTLSRYKSEFQRHTNLSVPDYDCLRVTRDKPGLLKIAAGLGIAVPKTWCPADLEEVKDLSGEIPYPCVIKYKRGTGAIGLRYANSAEDLVRRYQAPEHPKDIVFDDVFPMIQEYIPGYTCDVSVLVNRGEPRAAIISRRIRTIPRTGGRSVVIETIRDPELKEQALRLLREVKWHGPAQVEFRRDPRDGKLKLMEVNCRFWGSLGASAEAGIDFVHLASRMAVEGDIEPVWDYRVQMRYRWVFPEELESALQAQDKLGAFCEYLRFKRGTRYDIWPSDPFPHLVKSALAVYHGARRFLPVRTKKRDEPTR